MEVLDRVAIEKLQRLCEWLDSLPYKSAGSRHISSKHPDLVCWLDPKWSLKRKYVDVIFYSVGWGWRLRKDWRKRLDEIMAGFPHMKPKDFVRRKACPHWFGQVLSVQIWLSDYPTGRYAGFFKVTVILEDSGVKVSDFIEVWEVVSEA